MLLPFTFFQSMYGEWFCCWPSQRRVGAQEEPSQEYPDIHEAIEKIFAKKDSPSPEPSSEPTTPTEVVAALKVLDDALTAEEAKESEA